MSVLSLKYLMIFSALLPFPDAHIAMFKLIKIEIN